MTEWTDPPTPTEITSPGKDNYNSCILLIHCIHAMSSLLMIPSEMEGHSIT